MLLLNKLGMEIEESEESFLLKTFGNLVKELLSGEVLVSRHVIGVVDTDSQVLGHESILNCLNNNSFKSLSEGGKSFVVVKLGSVEESSSPCEDGSNWVS